MNFGFCEAKTLAGLLKRVLREEAPLGALEQYNREQESRWRPLVGLGAGLRPRPETNPWVREHCAQLLPCLPGCGEDLAKLADQLGLDIG